MSNIKNSLHIDKGSYVGYLWLSDASEPLVADNVACQPEWLAQGVHYNAENNPFVVEGLLYDEKQHKSVSIKYVDGSYVVSTYLVNESDWRSDKVTVQCYRSHRMNGRVLKFLQYWEEEKPEEAVMTEGMTSLRPGALVFVGFDNI